MFDLFRSRAKAVRYLLGAILIVVALSMVITLIPGFVGSSFSSDTNVIAEIGKEVLTVRDVQVNIQQQLRNNAFPREMAGSYVPMIINQMIADRAISFEAERLGFSVTDAEVAMAVQTMIPQLFQNGEFVGKDVYSQLRFEGGVHRVQRVPATETQGRIHTSTATVAVLPEADDVEVQIDEKDLEISIAASGGPGGQGVNTTNSAVQVKHLPTGILVRSEEQRSQHQNKDRALQLLRAKLLEAEQEAQDASITAERRTMVGSGERSEKIRTYNYPQNRVTDHRIQLTLHNLDRVMEGECAELVTALRSHHQAELLRLQGERDD